MPTSHRLNPGDIVDITIRGARIVGWPTDDTLQYTTEADGKPVGHILHIGKDWPGHTVQRVAPKEYPPHAGDIWRTWTAIGVYDHAGNDYGDCLAPRLWTARQIEDDFEPKILLFDMQGEDRDAGRNPHEVAQQSARTPELVVRLPEPAGEENFIYDVPDTTPTQVQALQQGDTVIIAAAVCTLSQPPRISEDGTLVTLILLNNAAVVYRRGTVLHLIRKPEPNPGGVG